MSAWASTAPRPARCTVRIDSRCGFRFSERDRKIAVNMRLMGWSLRAITAELGCSPSIICRWVRKAGKPACRAGQRISRPEITGEIARLHIRKHGSMRAAARALHMSYGAFERRANGDVVTG